MTKKKNKNIDGHSADGSAWLYSNIVKDHFFNPRNFMRFGEEMKFKFNAQGCVGSPACGDEMHIWLRIDPKTEKIKDIRWRTFGCGSAIAATSVLSEMVLEKGGLTLNQALKIKPNDIMKRLGGLPTRKIHCSVLGDKALEAAVNDYYIKSGQKNKIVLSGTKVIDLENNITDKDIEEAVLHGAKNTNDVMNKLNIKLISDEARVALEELVRYYTEKYY